ncbi:MAG TPA: hypothetical protein VFX59_20800 [Polyangiales bacterium]|nr:hypothetical protein [Polyangiales bacterium]
MARRALTLILLGSACAAQAVHQVPEVPEQLEVGDMEHTTNPWSPRTTRYVRPERAVAASTAVCDRPRAAEAPPVARRETSYELDDSAIDDYFQRERAASQNPPAVHCHLFVGEPPRSEDHFGVRGGERTNLRRADLVVELNFAIDLHEGSSVAVEVRKRDDVVVRFAQTVALSAMPQSCGAPGFTGWLRSERAPELHLYCDTAR